MASPKSLELVNIPEMEPNISIGRIIDGDQTVLVYEAKGDGWPDCGDSFAVLAFERCAQILAGSPNDEALVNHPLYPAVGHYAACEVLDSPWLLERRRIADKDQNLVRSLPGYRHLVFAFKENTVELIAAGYRTLGVFQSLEEAVDRASAAAFSLPPRVR